MQAVLFIQLQVDRAVPAVAISAKEGELVMFLTFHDEQKAREFEYYLKTQSGRAFLSKRLL